jgi:hypothetical protein
MARSRRTSASATRPPWAQRAAGSDLAPGLGSRIARSSFGTAS